MNDGQFSKLLADHNHAAAGVAGRVEAERIIARVFHAVPGFGDDLVAFFAAGNDSLGVAFIP
ncbi:hypothetical protein D3C85_1925780 [compost metagenome]